MILQLDIERLRTLDEVRDFMAGSTPVDFRFVERADAYAFVRRFLVRSRYLRLPRSDKGLVRRFLIKVTGFSRAQTARLITQYRETGRIEDRRRGPKRPFRRRYTKEDIRLLARGRRVPVRSVRSVRSVRRCHAAHDAASVRGARRCAVQASGGESPTAICTVFASP